MLNVYAFVLYSGMRDISKIHSLSLDRLDTSQLLIAYAMGNKTFNEVMEASEAIIISKPYPCSTRNERKAFINAKYR